jgi:hypothetical protein
MNKNKAVFIDRKNFHRPVGIIVLKSRESNRILTRLNDELVRRRRSDDRRRFHPGNTEMDQQALQRALRRRKTPKAPAPPNPKSAIEVGSGTGTA